MWIIMEEVCLLLSTTNMKLRFAIIICFHIGGLLFHFLYRCNIVTRGQNLFLCSKNEKLKMMSCYK